VCESRVKLDEEDYQEEYREDYRKQQKSLTICGNALSADLRLTAPPKRGQDFGHFTSLASPKGRSATAENGDGEGFITCIFDDSYKS
jgi:hypothetical protein